MFLWSFFLFFNWGLFPVVFEGTKLNSIGADNQVFWQNRLHQKSVDEWGWTQDHAKQVLVESKFDCLHWLAAVFDHGQLDDDGGNKDHQEQWVVEEVFKNVHFWCLQLSGVDLVENLQQDENVEENWVVLTSLIIPVFNVNWWWNSEDFRSLN